MTKIAVAGLGDMGSGIAANLLKNTFQVMGFDPDQNRKNAFAKMGGQVVQCCQELGNADVVFVMVMNGKQVQSVVNDVCAGELKSGSTIIITATIHPHEKRAIMRLLLLVTWGENSSMIWVPAI